MTMKKKILTTLSVVLILGLAALGILAYLTDTDSDVNVMTLGNVDIEQIEQERNDATAPPTEENLKEFSSKIDSVEKKPLFPAVFDGSSIPWDQASLTNEAWKVVQPNANVVDKFVTVKNTGKSSAYVRTLIAYEGNAEYGPEGPWIHIVHNGTNVEPDIAIDCIGTVNINNVDYTVYEYVYPEALASGETSIPSLKQIYMNNKATNEVVAQYGDTYDILVLSQAGQVEGFETVGAASALDTMFGETTVDNAKKWFNSLFVDEWDGTVDKAWFDADVAAAATPENPVVFEVDTAEEFTGFVNLANTNSFKNVTVKLTKDIDLGGSNWNEGGAIAAYGPAFSGTLDGNGHTIYNLGAANNWTYANALFRTIGNDVTIKNLNIEDANINNAAASGKNKEYAILVGIVGSGTLTIENVTIADSSVSCKNSAGILVGGMTEGAIRCKDVTIENCAVNVSSASGKGGAVLGDGWSAHDYDYAGVYTDNVKLVNCTYTVAGVLQAELPLYNYVK